LSHLLCEIKNNPEEDYFFMPLDDTI
jgi:hypothetical protein